MKYDRVAFMLLLALAGCQSSGGSGSSPSASGQVVAASGMPDFCRQQASQQLGPSLENISTDDPTTTSGGTTITGQWTDPNTGDEVGNFACRFGSNGGFQGVSRT